MPARPLGPPPLGPRLRLPRLFAALLFAALLVPGLAAKVSSPLEPQRASIWPTPVWRVRRSKKLQEEQRRQLASVAEKGYRLYVEEILPKEFKADAPWREAYESAEGTGSRDNLAFLRWQKVAYSKQFKRPLQELKWDGSTVPKYTGIPYGWKLYKSSEYKAFYDMVMHYASAYVSSFNRHSPDRFVVFPWAEVYRPGGFHEPVARTGAPAAGIYVAEANGEQELVFMDERSYGAPYNRRHSVRMATGDMLIFPAWATNMLTVNNGNSSNVYFRFWVSFPGGVRDFDWEDDQLSIFTQFHRERLDADGEGATLASKRRARAEEL